ncbi:MAG: LysR family transcriptional regulator [Lachnospiraceae bacterium]
MALQQEPLAPDISIQQIQIFLKAVEPGNFSRVGECLNYSTSTISKKITMLEESLGIQLFTRNPHDVVPTPEARMLAAEWRHVIASINNSIASPSHRAGSSDASCIQCMAQGTLYVPRIPSQHCLYIPDCSFASFQSAAALRTPFCFPSSKCATKMTPPRDSLGKKYSIPL